MAGSRLDRIGTIFSRATGLIKAGAMKYQDRPLWYDVYRIFPPKYEPHIDRQPQKAEINEILYREDKFRALFFKKYGLNPRGAARNLSDRSSQEQSHSFVTTCLEVCKQNPEWNDEEVFDRAVEKYKLSYSPVTESRRVSSDHDAETISDAQASRRHARKPATVSAQSLLELFKEAKEEQEKGESQVKQPKSDSESDSKSTK